ncbi:phage late control D family protein [Aquamicrobium zhengzhouense]|uniref:Phage late control D family protein n=1 Tax=Aquamicrobium zhengzhouense TaxID=2781738 RepID=A0ABS0SDE9_9HYPH|nr:contractile injection system protein, VgrG/Pvc8 family [Aquamicrobium zhengzhouense]MBI1620799.1 phage late control D family protein [Aquamicrobium zhengzhouense]
MHPIVEMTVDGQPVAGAFYERLVSLTVTDKEGVSSDTFSAELNDGPPDFLALPRTGASVEIRLGYRETGVSSVGTFTVDKVDAKCLPYGLTISGKAADLRNSKLKETQERHWDNKTLGDIVKEIAGDVGLSAVVDSEVGSHFYEWIAQQDEPPIQFLERMASRHDALFSIKNGKLIFAKKHAGKSASGASTGAVVVTPDRIIQGTCQFEAADRSKYKKVVAYYHDREKGERVEVEADADSEGEAVLRLTDPLTDEAEAKKAAESKANDLERGKGSASVTVVGDTGIIAGAPLLFEGVRPGLDGVPYVIDSVEHSYSKTTGFTTHISAKLYDGKSASKGKNKGSASDPASGDASGANADKKAPDAPAGTPATPKEWIGNRRTWMIDHS